MSVQIIKSKCGLVLTCLLGQIILFAAPVQAGVEGKSYNVNVNSSLGDNFTACFEFKANGSLRFVGLDATYSRTNLGQDQKNWQAVTKPPSVVSIALNGEVIGDFVPDRRINGNAINSNGTTFTFNGTRLSDPTCPPFAIQGIDPENPFLK
ncbi:hypothetical protein [uncultured Nostoc sp.]|uniref:hypothetical protein n=1 Tax=uncultured Nostoc sp. TaxID=340711 RepID=UPI002616DFB6|nr:hypothetical protein [uncultured Nostoc sp.]